MTKIINLYGGPGTGKSTTAAHLFAQMKLQHTNVELVTEYAKDKVWEGSFNILGNQMYILGKQYHRLWRLLGKVDYVVTDSPLLLSLWYGRQYGDAFKNIVHDIYKGMDNIDIFLTREKKYQPAGRMQTEEQAKEIDGEIRKILDQYAPGYSTVPANKEAARAIMAKLALEEWLA